MGNEDLISLITRLAGSAMGVFLPYFLPFVFGMMVVLLITALLDWSDISDFMLIQGWWLWLTVACSGAVTLMVGLMPGLLSYGVAGYLLGSPADSLIWDLR